MYATDGSVDAGPAPSQRPNIPSLTGIRALAASWVVLQHYQIPVTELLPGVRFLIPITQSGFLGVEVFFILSGFVIAYNYAGRLQTKGSYRQFLLARAARIYPVHLVTLAVMGVLVLGAAAAGMSLTSDSRNTVANFAGNMLMLQAVPGFRGFNWPSWSVSCEAAAYLLFPLLAWWAAKLSPARSLGWAALVLIAGISAIQLVALTGKFWTMDYSVMWIRIASEFTTGVLLWAWWNQTRRVSRRWDALAIAAVAGVVAICFAVSNESPAAFFALPLIALFVISCVGAAGPVDRLLSTRPFQWGGRISYSLYMTHFIVFLIGKKVVGWDRFVDSSLFVRLGVVTLWAVLVVVAAAGFYYAVEEPGRRLVRRWSTRGAVRTS